jgi:hypothetical protein
VRSGLEAGDGPELVRFVLFSHQVLAAFQTQLDA